MGLYIHIPFCAKKCGYCDFLSFDSCDIQQQRNYIDGLIKEITMYGPQGIAVDSLFIGGGTPSILPGQWIADILQAVERNFFLSHGEKTIEANPGTLSEEKLKIYRKAGMNRLSMGVQSLDDRLLAAMGRIHTAQQAVDNFYQTRKAGFSNINLDLMFGLPGQSDAQWKDTLKQAVDLGPEHISFYSLQLEEGTDFYRAYQKDKLSLPDDEEDRRMYHEAIEILSKSGYDHYEISNCAQKGYSCRHNLKYWSMESYIGIGLGAHSFSLEEGRRCNTRSMTAYLRQLQEGKLPVDDSLREPYSSADAMSEYVFTGLRKTEGIDLEYFFLLFGKDFYQVFEKAVFAIEPYKQQGYLHLDPKRFFLTEKGLDISNKIMAEFV